MNANVGRIRMNTKVKSSRIAAPRKVIRMLKLSRRKLSLRIKISV
jgi:hypothetical protein